MTKKSTLIHIFDIHHWNDWKERRKPMSRCSRCVLRKIEIGVELQVSISPELRARNISTSLLYEETVVARTKNKGVRKRTT